MTAKTAPTENRRLSSNWWHGVWRTAGWKNGFHSPAAASPFGGTRFRIFLNDSRFIQEQSLLGRRHFEYASAEIGRAFEQHLADLTAKREPFQVEFSHPKEPSDPLVLEGVFDAE